MNDLETAAAIEAAEKTKMLCAMTFTREELELIKDNMEGVWSPNEKCFPILARIDKAIASFPSMSVPTHLDAARALRRMTP